MGRGDKFSCKRKTNRRFRSNDKGSDESDEDYVVSDQEEEESEADLEEYCSSLDGEASNESLNGLDEELDELEEEIVRQRNVGRPKEKKGHYTNRKIGGKKSRRTNKVLSDDEDEGEEEDDADYEEDEEEEVSRTKKVGKPKAKAGSLVREKNRGIRSGKRRTQLKKEDEDDDYRKEEDDEEENGAEEEERYMEKVSEKVDEDILCNGENGVITSGEQDDVLHETEEDDDGDYENEDDDEDEEFTPDEYVSLEEEEEDEIVVGSKKNNTLKGYKTSKRKRKSGGCGRKKKKYSVAKPCLPKRGKKTCGRKRKERSDDDGDFVDAYSFARKKAKKKPSRRRARYTVASDSDFASSGESDYEYTISEEEREQVREASKLLRTTSRAISSSKQAQVTEDLPQFQKSPVKKGKEKVEVVIKEVIKQVCGICLSEEDRRRLRGTLDCCSHYFCFTCIMEWSKVESRCPLCKQRFRAISKPARSAPGVDLREVVIPVPERDQVYQPTEEELRSYLDPYENVICTECHQGEDDGLMLLCDLCDSSAHTYCVGLGREVPEGNWYCEGCRPVALGSPSSQAHRSEQRTTNGWYNRPSPFAISGESLDASLLTSPRTPFFHGFENLLSPRLPNGDVQGSSPSGSGAPTLSRRRTLHRHIQNIINSNRLNGMVGRTDGTSVANSSNGSVASHIDRGRETEPSQPVKTQETGMPLYTIFEERERDNNQLSSIRGTELVSSRCHNLRREESVRDSSNNTSAGNRSSNMGLWPGLAEAGTMTGNQQQNQPSYMPNTVPVFRVAPEGDFSTAREQLQLTVKTHLKNLSRQIDVGQATFNEIVTCSIHTILEACGLEHRSSEVHVIKPPVTCLHGGEAGEMGSSSLMKGCCSACFDSFVKDVVKMIMETRQPHWLSLGL